MRTLLSAAIPVALLVSVAIAPLSATARGARPAAPPQSQPMFRAEAELVVLHATVRDRGGAYVTGLPETAFTVSEDGRPQPMAFFTGEDSPVTVGLLVDSSGSMREGRDRVIAAATAFAMAGNPEDEIFALAFNDSVHSALPPGLPFTSDPAILRRGLASVINPRGLTALHDAVSQGLVYVGTGRHPRRVLIVVGDGGDNASVATFDAVLRQAQASNAAIYTVGLLDPVDRRDANPDRLRQLARATGGESFFPTSLDEVDDVLARIARDIRNTYTIGYVSTNPRRDGTFRRVHVTVTAPGGRGLRVRTRGGYLAGAATPGKE